MFINPNLLVISQNGPGSSLFVKTSASWSWFFTNGVSITFVWTFYCTERQSTSMCLVLSWKNWIRYNMSICMIITKYCHRFMIFDMKSANTCLIQVNSLTINDIARYFTSAPDLATTSCFLFFPVDKIFTYKCSKVRSWFFIKAPCKICIKIATNCFQIISRYPYSLSGLFSNY